jgi:type IV pilus assembly protein PilN
VFTAAAAAVIFLSFLLLGWHVYKVRRADTVFRVQSSEAAKELDQLNTERQELDQFFSRPENARLHDRAAFVNTIIDRRSFNWTRMFMDLEKILPGGMRVISIEPKLENGQASLKLTVGAASEEAKEQFLEALLKSDAFSHFQLSSVHAPQQDSADFVVLELTVVYSRA